MNDRTISRRRCASSQRTARIVGWTAASLLAATAPFAPAVSAASVAPIAIDSGSPTCADLAPVGASWTQFKLEGAQLANGAFSDGTLTVTIAGFVGSSSGVPGTFDWASTVGVDAVFVKAGSSKHQLYVYAPESTGDVGLSPQAGKGNGISHILFCYEADSSVAADPTTEPSPTAHPSPDPTPDAEVEDPTPTPAADASPAPTPDPTQAPETIVDPTPSPTSTPTPESGELPAGEEQPECGHMPEDDVPPLDAVVPDGAVLSATGTPTVTLPPTDGLARTELERSADWRIVIAGLAGLVFAILVLTPPRHGPIRR